MQANLTIKGQVTIPKAMRDYLKLTPGAAVRFAYTENGGVAILPATGRSARTGAAKAGAAKKTRFEKLIGVNRKGWAATGLKSTDQIMEWLRGDDEDPKDPGFKTVSRARSK